MKFVQLWSAPAERSGDGALDGQFWDCAAGFMGRDPKRRRRFALPAHSKISVESES
jgi:hypothetical protein